MIQVQREKLSSALAGIIRQHVSEDVWQWMHEKASSSLPVHFNTAFVVMPRKTGKQVIHVTEEQEAQIEEGRPGFKVQSWTTDRLARVWLLLQLDEADKETYFRTIENLFLAAEMHELVALYSALPVLAYPEVWASRCAEGIRSNIGIVLEAIMCNNPYPSENLGEAAWNQLVLKAFFTEKPIHQIIGLDTRANPELANILSDYAHERWAAHRPVNPQLWRCVGQYIDDNIFPDIKRIAASENTIEREAAALACRDSNYLPAKELLDQNSDLKAAIEAGELTWISLAEKPVLITHHS
jgi:hypothetical protein